MGRELDLDIGPVGHGGFCVARHEGQVVFVRHTLPGERVRARVTAGGSQDRFLRADAVAILAPSADRVGPVCRHAGPPTADPTRGGCGGCDWQHATLTAQRELKAAVVAEQFARLAGLSIRVPVLPVSGDDAGLRWRTRVEFAVDGRGRAGLRPVRSRAVLPISECPIAVPAVVESGVLERDWTGYAAVDVVCVGTDPAHVVPVGGDAPPAPVVTESVTTAGWTGRYAVSARGFWQVHPGAAATFLGHVLDALAPQPGERVLDVYAGVGLFAVPMADAVGPAGSVLAVEGDPLSCEHARANAGERPHLQVVTGRVEEQLSVLAAHGADVVVLDPPRTGAGRTVMQAVLALHPRAIAYVACDPAALARDTAYALEGGYRLGSLTAYDAFPMTHHVECVAVLVPG